jgi:hypothetical protein
MIASLRARLTAPMSVCSPDEDSADVTVAEARDSIQAAAEILQWRLGCAPEWRVLRLAKALLERERRRPGDLFEPRR